MTPEEKREYKRRYAIAWRAANPERERETRRRQDAKRAPAKKLYDAARRAANPGLVKEQSRRWYEANAEKARIKADQWRKEHPKERQEQLRRWNAENPDYHREYARDRYHSDENARISALLCGNLHRALKRHKSGRDWKSDAKLAAIVGCSKPELIVHIEAQFLPGMAWENYGRKGWEVDHVRQRWTFDLTDHAQVLACFHYTNLRPLWRPDNLRRPRKE
jgi:hypothetical protein